ncbi:MAG: GNAT family N-acetyltransferase, partial [Deinococcus sp.]
MRHDLILTDGDLTLRPLTEEDIPALTALAAEAGDELRHMGTPPHLPEGHYHGLAAPDQMPFVVVQGGDLVGSTRYGSLTDFSAEIGWTWLHPRLYGSGVNRRMKRLMLAHAFEVMGMARVQLKTDILNLRS